MKIWLCLNPFLLFRSRHFWLLSALKIAAFSFKNGTNINNVELLKTPIVKQPINFIRKPAF